FTIVSLINLSIPSLPPHLLPSFLLFTYTATTAIYTLSLHDALPICAGRLTEKRLRSSARRSGALTRRFGWYPVKSSGERAAPAGDRKSTRLNSSHVAISYAVFCLKKKKEYHASATGVLVPQACRLSY